MCTVCVPVKLCIREGGVSCHSGRFTGGASPALPATAVSAPRTAPGRLSWPLASGSSQALPAPPHPSLSTEGGLWDSPLSWTFCSSRAQWLGTWRPQGHRSQGQTGIPTPYPWGMGGVLTGGLSF